MHALQQRLNTVSAQHAEDLAANIEEARAGGVHALQQRFEPLSTQHEEDY